MTGEKLKLPEDWGQLVKTLKYKERKVLNGILDIPNKLEELYSERQQIMKMKTQVFGKGKISLTILSSSFQRESRLFANLFAHIVSVLQQMKKDKNAMDVSNITPINNEEKEKPSEIEENSHYNESES